MSSSYFRCPSFIEKRKDGLTFQLFAYLTIIIVSIFIFQGIAEKALMRALLKVPDSVKSDMLDLAYQADILIEEGDMDELADWANAQEYYLFVLDKDKHPITHRHMHPHFEFKLRFLRDLDHQLDAQVNQPILGIPLKHDNLLVVQFPRYFHPAHTFSTYSSLMKVFIAFVILILFSQILSRRLQQPLDRLREASRRLAQGDFSVEVVSELKSNTREFNELASDFDHMTQEIKSLGEKQRRLIRDVSHELRTPLARQNLVLHLLRNSVEDKSTRLIDRLENETKEMNDLVGEILEYSRLENARYDADVTSMNVEHYCSLLVSEMQHDLKGEQTLVAHLSNQTPSVDLDERLVLRVVRNIVGNAIKYAGSEARIALTTYYYEESSTKRYTVISIEDNGPGIPDEQLSSVFSPFTRLESARDKKSGGYGLGLAIVKESMAVMNGHVKAENKSEGGLRINLMFPVQP